MTMAFLLSFGVWASWKDGQEFIIPDKAIIMGLALILFGTLTGGLSAIASLAGMGLGISQFGLVFGIVKGRLGLGDVKYAGILGGLLGPWLWMAALTGALVTILIHIGIDSIREGQLMRHSIPFAPFLTMGALAALIFERGGSL